MVPAVETEPARIWLIVSIYFTYLSMIFATLTADARFSRALVHDKSCSAFLYVFAEERKIFQQPIGIARF